MPDLLLVVIGTVLTNHLLLAERHAPALTRPAADLLETDSKLALASTLTTLLAAAVMLAVDRRVLVPNDAGYIRVFAAIASSAAAARLVFLLARKVLAAPHALAAALPTANGAILTLVLLRTTAGSSAAEAVAVAVGLAAGTGLLLVACGEAFRRIDHPAVPWPFRGPPLMMLTAGIAALGLLGLPG